MKKIFMILVTLTIASCASRVEEQKFINPIFYKVMEPLSTGTWYTQITPTEMVSSNKGDVLKQNCTLTENTMEAVTLQCEGPYNKKLITLYRFVLKPEIKDYNGIFVFMYDKWINDKKFISHESLIIPYNN